MCAAHHRLGDRTPRRGRSRHKCAGKRDSVERVPWATRRPLARGKAVSHSGSRPPDLSGWLQIRERTSHDAANDAAGHGAVMRGFPKVLRRVALLCAIGTGFAPSMGKGTLMKRHSASYLFVLTLVLLLATASRLSAQTVMWDANSEPDIAGYILYYGNSSGVYSNQVDVGNRTSYSLSIDWSRTWFFALQAYSTAGLTSPLSGEVQWTPIATPSQGTRLTALEANAAGPYLVGQPVTWTAAGTSSNGPVEYRFWMSSAGSWRMVQDYSPSPAFSWVPNWADQGPHLLQVWARSVGTTGQYRGIPRDAAVRRHVVADGGFGRRGLPHAAEQPGHVDGEGRR